MRLSLHKFLMIGITLWLMGIALFCYVRLEQVEYVRKMQEERRVLDFIFGPPEDSSAYQAWKIGGHELMYSVSISCMVFGAGPFAYWFLLWLVRMADRRSSQAVRFVIGVVRKRKRIVMGELDISHTKDLAQKIDTLYCDKKSLGASKEQASLSAEQLKKLEDNIRKTIVSGYRENANAVEKSLKVQGASLEKKLAEFKKLTEMVDSARQKGKNGGDTDFGELAQQISAIRDYTSSQQDRIDKLQDGYDWTIMRTFCLKIIRCIDNLENRIQKMLENGLDTESLEDIRDELLFSLESSNVEQYELEVGSEYGGNEKLAEVVKEKSPCKDKSMKGKISSLIRPGYQYIIGEGTTKVVRVARVKLYG